MSRVPGSRRPGPNGAGYTNGYGRSGGYGGGDEDYEPRRPSTERRRRPGGYGGLEAEPEQDSQPGVFSGYRGGGGYGGYNPQEEEDAPVVARPTSLERREAQRRSGERRYGDDSSRSRSRTGTGAGRFGPGSQQMEG